MPLTRISVPQHLLPSQVKALAVAVQTGLVQTCDVPVDDCFQLITRFAAENMNLNSTFGNMARTRDASVVEITFLQGRTDEQKRALYRRVTDDAAAAGYKPDDIMIALTENAPIDWTLGQGLAFTGNS